MFKELNDRAYLIGGAPRNMIMGLEVKDYDYVIADTTEEEFESIFPEAKRVGKDFPVYILDGNEVALAREEKSIGDKYQDFEFTTGVSIHEDLLRRDFLINAICIKYDTKEYFDPYGGINDIKNKIIRATNGKSFEDDPLRILRGLRFACEFGFDIEEHTLELMRASVDRLKHLSIERVDLEIEKVYERCEKPSQFFRLLDSIGGLYVHFKELELAKDVIAGAIEWHPEITTFNHCMESFDRAKESGYSFSCAISALCHDFGKLGTNPIYYPRHLNHENNLYYVGQFLDRHRFDSYTNKLCLATAKNHMRVHLLERITKPVKLIRFIKSVRRNLLDDFLKATDCDARHNEEQKKILDKLIKVVDNTTIELPDEVKAKGTEAIKNYVENVYTKKYKELTNVSK